MGCFLQKVAVGKLERLRTSLFPMGWDGAGIKVLAQQRWWCWAPGQWAWWCWWCWALG